MNNSSNGFWENPKNMLAGVINAFNVITNRGDYKHKITKQPISFNDIKISYGAFYAGYHWLINNKKISGEKKKDLIAKKQIVDGLFNQNIPNKKIYYKTNTEENTMLKIHKSVANRIPTTNTNVNSFASNLSRLKLQGNK